VYFSVNGGKQLISFCRIVLSVARHRLACVVGAADLATTSALALRYAHHSPAPTPALAIIARITMATMSARLNAA
jgi:hypothetical protein